MPGQTFFESLKIYVGFTDESSGALRAAHVLVAPHVAAIIDDFYATIEAHPGARQAITGGDEQIARLKMTLRGWLEELLLGPHDHAYFDRRARIGRVHVRINLPQGYMFTAMDRIRVRTAAVIEDTLAGDRATRARTLMAMHQIMDIELAVMLETYREDLVAKNRTAERLATIGQFAAGIGHELRNPLGVVESSVFLLRQNLPREVTQDPKVSRHLEKITTEVKRSNKTINELLELARNRPPRRRRVPLAGLLNSAIAAASLPFTVDVEVLSAPGDMAPVDPDQIGRVVTNLLINAGQAMEGKGKVWLEAEHSEHEARIRVRDTGPGVPADIRHRIFEALFTTKAKGSGLGLALCLRIAEAHGGTIVLEPSSGDAVGGASFLLRVPDGEVEQVTA